MKTDSVLKGLVSLLIVVLGAVGWYLRENTMEVRALRQQHAEDTRAIQQQQNKDGKRLVAIACALEIQAGGTCWPED